MTAPVEGTGPDPAAGGPGSSGPGTRGGKPAPAPAPVDLLSVVRFTHDSPIHRGRVGVGVVVAVDDQGVDVIPVSHHRLRLARDAVTVVTADETDEV